MLLQCLSLFLLDTKPTDGHPSNTEGPAGESVLKLGLENELEDLTGAKKAQRFTHILDGGSLIEEKPKAIWSNSLTTFCSEVTETGSSPQDKGDERDPLIVGKRLHKPPRRYIEESLEPKSRSISRKRCRTHHRASKVKPLSVKLPKEPTKQLSHEDNGTLLSMQEEEPFNGACIQVPFGLPVEEEQVKETPSSLGLSIVLVGLLMLLIISFLSNPYVLLLVAFHYY